MNPGFKPLVDWFGYSRRERRASIVLLILIVIITSVRYLVPEKPVPVEDLSALLPDMVIDQPDIPVNQPGTSQKEYRNEAFSSSGRTRRGPNYQLKKVDLNSADSAGLEALPGIGPVLSARIIKYRNLLGGYAAVEQLREVYGLRDSTFHIISGMVTADSLAVVKININTADFRALVRHPYLERYEVQAILKFRELSGRITGITDLVENKILTGERAGKLLPYLKFD
jgi:DNA uptake protein ComE-like DNA-binding protein